MRLLFHSDSVLTTKHGLAYCMMPELNTANLTAKAVILQLPHSSSLCTSTGTCMHMTPAMEVTATSYDWNFQKHWSGLPSSESMS